MAKAEFARNVNRKARQLTAPKKIFKSRINENIKYRINQMLCALRKSEDIIKKREMANWVPQSECIKRRMKEPLCCSALCRFLSIWVNEWKCVCLTNASLSRKSRACRCTRGMEKVKRKRRNRRRKRCSMREHNKNWIFDFCCAYRFRTITSSQIRRFVSLPRYVGHASAQPESAWVWKLFMNFASNNDNIMQ